MMKRLLKSAAVATLLIMGVTALPSTDANAFWGGWWPWNWGRDYYGGGPWGGYPGYGYGYPGYGYGYPGYGYGGYPGYYGYPGYGYGGYPGYWGHPGWGYGYPYAVRPAAPAAPKAAAPKSAN